MITYDLYAQTDTNKDNRQQRSEYSIQHTGKLTCSRSFICLYIYDIYACVSAIPDQLMAYMTSHRSCVVEYSICSFPSASSSSRFCSSCCRLRISRRFSSRCLRAASNRNRSRSASSGSVVSTASSASAPPVRCSFSAASTATACASA